jgi:hypothetical protein
LTSSISKVANKDFSRIILHLVHFFKTRQNGEHWQDDFVEGQTDSRATGIGDDDIGNYTLAKQLDDMEISDRRLEWWIEGIKEPGRGDKQEWSEQERTGLSLNDMKNYHRRTWPPTLHGSVNPKRLPRHKV